MRPGTRPNVLFLLSDQHRGDFLGSNPGLPVRTPNIEELARRGTAFANAFTPSPLCAPARACLASGLDYRRCGVPDNHHDYPLGQPTYYSLLRDGGYHVAGVGKFDLHKATFDWNLDGSYLVKEWGFSEGIDSEGKGATVRSGADAPKGPYMAYLHERGLAAAHVAATRGHHHYREPHVTPLPDEAYGDNWIAENGLRLLREFPHDRPWHLVVNFAGPHPPLAVTEGMMRRWEGVEFPPPHDNDQWPAETHQRVRRAYAAMIENIDRQLGRFVEAVRARGELDNTLVVYSSDHGEMLGDHNRWGKSIYYQPAVNIPLIVAGPNLREGCVSAALGSLHDLAATFLACAGIAIPAAMDSRSLKPLLEERQDAHREIVLSELGDWWMAFDGRYKLVSSEDADPVLYDLLNDPWEDHNVAEANPAEVGRLRRAAGREP